MTVARDVVCLSTNHWSGLPTSKQHLMSVVARSRRVLYVEPPIDVFSTLGRPRRWRKLAGLSRVDERLWVSSPLVVRAPGTPDARLTFHAGRTERVRRLLSRLGLDAPIAWAFAPEHLAYAGRLGESLLVYHAADEPAATSLEPTRTAEIERALMDRADLVFVASQALLDARAPTGKVVRLANAADRTHYARVLAGDASASLERFLGALEQPRFCPRRLARAPRPLVLFGGAAYEWFDETLFLDLARLRPCWTFALVGPLGRALKSRAFPGNVRAVGRRPYEDFPWYVAACDAAILPLREGLTARNCDPIVLYEYLLCGKPVVATPFPAALERGDLVSTAGTAEGFAAALEAALGQNDEEARTRRVEFAFANTWEARVERALNLIGRALERRRPEQCGATREPGVTHA